MEKQIRVQVQFLEEGMVLGRDVIKSNTLLVAAGTQLTKKMILQFVNTRISFVWINEEVQTQNFKIYEENLNGVHKIFCSLEIGKGITREDTDKFIYNFNNVRSQRSLLRYIYGIRKVDQYTFQHSLNVAYLAFMLAKWSDFSKCAEAAMAGLLHDVGKIRIDNKILNKPASLTEKEWAHMKRHSYLGYHLLQNSLEIPEDVRSGVLYHHERMDGSGYPQGLSDKQVPEVARIVAIADVFDAMTSDRVYRDKKDVFEVLQYMHDQHQAYDLRLLRIFTENMLDILVGEQVMLSNNQSGKIVFNNVYRPFAPLIQTDDGFIDLSTENGISIARVL